MNLDSCPIPDEGRKDSLNDSDKDRTGQWHIKGSKGSLPT